MITWINCAERMPPDDEIVIYRSISGGRNPRIWKGSVLNENLRSAWEYEWTPYTKEAWSELNKVQ